MSSSVESWRQVLDLDAREAGDCPIGHIDIFFAEIGHSFLHEVGYCKAIEKILVPSDRSIILRTAGSSVCSGEFIPFELTETGLPCRDRDKLIHPWD